MFGIVWGLVRGNEQGWTSPEILAALSLGAALVAAFVAWELRAPSTRCCRCGSSATRPSRSRTLSSLFMFFGMFGSIFLLTQFFQTVQGYSPLASGLRILPWTLAPMFVAPVAGALSDRIAAKKILGTGLALQAIALAWIAFVSTPTTPYAELIVPFVIAGVGMALFFAPMANVVLSAVRPRRGGPGVGRQQRDPRARRRLRRRGARLGLLAVTAATGPVRRSSTG